MEINTMVKGETAPRGLKQMDKNVKMKSGLLIAAILASFVTANAGWAYDENVFPGVGEKTAWMKARVPFNEGIDLANNGQWNAAIAKYKQALSIYPYSDGYYHNIGVAYEKRGKPGDLKLAENFYRKAVEIGSTDARNWNALAGFLGEQKRYKECKDVCELAISKKLPEEEKEKLRSNIKQLNKLLLSKQ